MADSDGVNEKQRFALFIEVKLCWKGLMPRTVYHQVYFLNLGKLDTSVYIYIHVQMFLCSP